VQGGAVLLAVLAGEQDLEQRGVLGGEAHVRVRERRRCGAQLAREAVRSRRGRARRAALVEDVRGALELGRRGQ